MFDKPTAKDIVIKEYLILAIIISVTVNDAFPDAAGRGSDGYVRNGKFDRFVVFLWS